MPKITQFEVSSAAHQLQVRCRVDEGSTLGCHWIDPLTGLFLRESDWVEAVAQEQALLPVDLPPAPGPYRFYVSTRDAQGRWAYAQGKEFLVIDAEISLEGIEIRRQRMMTLGELRRERWPGVAREILFGPFLSIWTNRSLIASMVQRDILSRYRGSFADAFWAILNPLMLMMTYFFVFGVVLRSRFPGDPTQEGFFLYFMAGMLPWLSFNESVARSPNTALEQRNLITKMIFPVEILPVNLTIAGLVTGFTALLIFLCFLLVLRGGIPWSVLYLPLLVIPQFLFTAGICYLFCAIGVYVRDLVYVISLLLTMWFFITPICYPDISLPEQLLPVLGKNPLYIFVRGYRAIFIERTHPEWQALWKLALLSLLMFYGGFAYFRRARKGFADVL
jgi:lipopolysaccharide transport system permease protein